MTINIASFGGRTHLLDTARELSKLGHTVRFYSYVPTKRAISFGLPKECNYSLFYWALPFLVLFKIFGFKTWLQYAYWYLFDIFTSFYMKPCDIFIGQSPMHNHCIKTAKKKGAKTILERGTSHVSEYIAHLKDNPHYSIKIDQPKYEIRRDLNGYTLPDYISVGASHVKESFLLHGFPSSKIFVNNYGFNNTQFYPTIYQGDYDIIMVGTWSYRKGCDLITEACIKKGYKLLHVGSCSDMAFPELSNCLDIGIKPEKELITYYSKAKVFVLPSREEGLAMVQMQAAACGLPIVCSKFSGGRDIRKYTSSKKWIIEIKEFNVDDLIYSIDCALQLAKEQTGKRNYLTDKFKEVSWEGYGKRYHDFILSI